MKKIFLILTLLVFALSCGKKSGSGSTFTLNIVTEPSSIDPQITTDIPGGTVDELILEGLLRKDKTGKSVAGIAQKWEKSKDGLVWTFHLRDGVKWSNGDPVTAKDFKAGWIRGLNPDTAGSNASMLFVIKNGEKYNAKKVSENEVGIKVIDDKTLQVTLESPTPYFDDLVTFKSFMPLNQKFYNEAKDKYFTEAKYTISNGPYTLEKWTHDSELKFKKNPNYWDAGNVKIDNVELKIIATDSAVNAFKNKEVDVTAVTFEQAKEFAGKPELVKANDGGIYYLLFNTKENVFKNAKVRRAITMAINKEELVNKVLEGSEKLTKTFTPSGIGLNGVSKDFPAEVATDQPKFNVAEAKKLLAEGLKEEGLSELPRFEILFNDTGSRKAIAEYIQESLRNNLGANVELDKVSGKERIERTKKRDYQISLQNWTGDFLDPITYLDLFDSTNANNRGDFKNVKYDELTKIVKSSADPKVRVPAMIQMEKLISEEQPVTILFQKQKLYLVNPKVKNLGFVSIGGEFFIRDVVMN
ncbi:family 5 extracellular solute-binding protein [Leptotrichia shahii]|uniref:Family 5 extracellular solute-binding protein n=1 Tax=Leptotrichia shahii TaxID=157691 RepID=A0A510JN49_9FUSO|nr:peptide ABC transporter substrate-binding protein [Leptotrichia shahii]BBM39831.1 family 5 extracellular solute-binding protein [Leptotrichia shahii]